MMRKGDGVMFKVTYTIKHEDKLLSDESATFRYLKDAFTFMRLLMNSAGLVGKPTIERM
jgi:hypothetical protein